MVFKGSLYLLNLICGIIPCEHKFPYPDTSPRNSQMLTEEVEYANDTSNLNNVTWKDGRNALSRNMDYNETDPLLIHTKTGMLKGYWMTVVGGRKIRAFEGLPYATPPTNDGRFRAPLPIKPWAGILQANLKGPKCLQYNDITSSRVIGSENCLYLNVYSSWPSSNKINSTIKYPVIIFIHGGGFLTGSGSDFGPAYLLQRDITIIYLGVNNNTVQIGNIGTTDSESPGNAGLKDQSEAISWVHQNIDSFNGDPNKIILLGHGSGGASIQFQMMSFRARGKFIAGIAISGSAFNQWAMHTRAQALNLTKAFAKAVRCPVHGSTKNMVGCLRNQRGSDLVKMQISFLDKWPLTLSLFRPVIEDEYQKEEPFLTETPEEAYQKGTVDKSPLICGHAEDEGYTFLLSHVALSTFGTLRKNWNSLAPDYFNYNDLPIDQDEITRRVNWLYFRHVDPSSASIKIYSDALGSRLIHTGIHKALQAHSQHAETYAFMFGYNGKYNLATTAGIRPSEWAVGHGEILGYILNSTDMYSGFQKNDSELVLSKILVNIISNFADKQVPGFTTEEGEKFHLWNPVSDPRNISFLHISKTIKMIPEPYLQQTLYWESLGLPDSLPLANFSNEIHNVTSAPKAKGFASTDITVTGNEIPSGLLPPVDLMPGTFENDNITFSSYLPTMTNKYPDLTTSFPLTSAEKETTTNMYPDLTTSSPIMTNTLTENVTSTPTPTRIPTLITPTTTATTETPSTTSLTTTPFPVKTDKPKFDRWLAQDYVPMSELALKFNMNFSSSSTEAPDTTTTTVMPTTKTLPDLNIFPNLIDLSPYDSSSKNVPFGISVPILPNQQTGSRFVTKSNISTQYYLNALGGAKTMLRVSPNPHRPFPAAVAYHMIRQVKDAMRQ